MDDNQKVIEMLNRIDNLVQQAEHQRPSLTHPDPEANDHASKLATYRQSVEWLLARARCKLKAARGLLTVKSAEANVDSGSLAQSGLTLATMALAMCRLGGYYQELLWAEQTHGETPLIRLFPSPEQIATAEAKLENINHELVHFDSNYASAVFPMAANALAAAEAVYTIARRTGQLCRTDPTILHRSLKAREALSASTPESPLL